VVYFQTKNPNLGKIWKALEWEMWVYLLSLWNILRPIGNFVLIWYIFPVLVYCVKKNLATLVQTKKYFTGLPWRPGLHSGIVSALQ
jgi:hypothetical protein